MKSILFYFGTSLLKRWLVPGFNQAVFGSDRTHLLNFSYLTKAAKQYALLAGIGFLAGLFLVAGTTMALFAAAQSIDLFGEFVGGAVFYTGLIIALLSAATLGGCAWWLKRHKIAREEFFLAEEPAGAYYRDSGPDVYRPQGGVMAALVSGFIDGWTKASRKPRDVPVDIRRAS